MSSQIKRVLVGLLAIGFICTQSLSTMGQVPGPAVPELMTQRAQPPMQNVFFNVLWGSVTGGMLMLGWATLDDSKPSEERYTVKNMTNQFLAGATYGGIIGLVAGVYISFKGITFDERRTRIAILQPPSREFFPSAKYSSHGAGINNQDLHLVELQFKF